MIHPDVHVLFPYPKDVDEREVGERLAMLAQNPYTAIDFTRRPSLSDVSVVSNKQSLYSVERVHSDLHRVLSYRPVEGRYKIAIVTEAERLRTEAASSFLKLLEEPGPQTVFILTTWRPDVLLPTILSRCQRVHFDMLSPDCIAEALVLREKLDPTLAETISRMADGSYTRALELSANEELQERRDIVLSFLRLCYGRDVNGLADMIEKEGRRSREQALHLLGLILGWVRDLVLFRTMGPAAPIVNVDQKASIAQFCDNLVEADLEAMVRIVEEAMELVGRNIHLKLLFIALAHALGRAMRGHHSGHLFVPLVEADAFT